MVSYTIPIRAVSSKLESKWTHSSKFIHLYDTDNTITSRLLLKTGSFLLPDFSSLQRSHPQPNPLPKHFHHNTTKTPSPQHTSKASPTLSISLHNANPSVQRLHPRRLRHLERRPNQTEPHRPTPLSLPSLLHPTIPVALRRGGPRHAENHLPRTQPPARQGRAPAMACCPRYTAIGLEYPTYGIVSGTVFDGCNSYGAVCGAGACSRESAAYDLVGFVKSSRVESGNLLLDSQGQAGR